MTAIAGRVLPTVSQAGGWRKGDPMIADAWLRRQLEGLEGKP